LSKPYGLPAVMRDLRFGQIWPRFLSRRAGLTAG
jgi:hypothetical protein